jgi:hypothetical protein
VSNESVYAFGQKLALVYIPIKFSIALNFKLKGKKAWGHRRGPGLIFRVDKKPAACVRLVLLILLTAMPNSMEQLLLDSNGELNITASKGSSPNDFDFLIGKWKIDNRKLKTRLNKSAEWAEFDASGECRKILNGFGNIDSFQTVVDRKPYEGMALRLFNPKTRLWSIYWANSDAVVLDIPQVGSFENKTGRFYAKDIFEGKNIIVQYHWDASNSKVPVWSQAFSADDGQTWEWNWYMTFYRQVEG